MKKKFFWQLWVDTDEASEAEVQGLLAIVTGGAPVAYQKEGSREPRLTVYLEPPAEEAQALRDCLREALRRLKAFRPLLNASEPRLERLEWEDWAESWKKHFKPLAIGRHLLIKPSWSRRQARPGQQVMVLDPGLSFGTGNHPTTLFCLRQLVRHFPRWPRPDLLDMGTGSGILALAAAKLGYCRVSAFDFDPVAVRVARNNCRANGAAVAVSRKDLREMPAASRKKYTVVCANLECDLLLSETARITARVAPDGLLLLAGVLRTQFARVREAYEKAGLALIAQQQENEWHSGAFEWIERPRP